MTIAFCRHKDGHAGPCEWVRADSQLKPKSFDQCDKPYWDSPEARAEQQKLLDRHKEFERTHPRGTIAEWAEAARGFNGEVGE